MSALLELKRIIRFPSALGGAVFSALIIILSLTGPYISPYSVGDQAINDRVSDRLQPPASKHILGTDHLGTDVLSLLLNGAPYTVFTGIFTAFVCTVLGTLAGLLCGFF